MEQNQMQLSKDAEENPEIMNLKNQIIENINELRSLAQAYDGILQFIGYDKMLTELTKDPNNKTELDKFGGANALLRSTWKETIENFKTIIDSLNDNTPTIFVTISLEVRINEILKHLKFTAGIVNEAGDLITKDLNNKIFKLLNRMSDNTNRFLELSYKTV